MRYTRKNLTQGRRKLRKVGGGPGFEGHFSEKKGHLKIIFGQCTILGVKKYSGYMIFFPEIKTFFRK
jgi:hypothetical protein